MNKRFSIAATALLLPLATSIGAQNAAGGGAEDEDLASLLALLEEETEIATRTRLNADFVPGIVAVLHGEDMYAMGARTVLDALALIPGLEVNRDDLGTPTLRPRGLDFFDNSGQVKVLINGLSYQRQASGINGSELLLPIEHVDRIEVIRGPGSGVHGDFAFAGLVNVITITGESGAYVAGGSGGLATAGVQLSHHDEASGVRMDLGLSTLHADELESAVEAPGVSEERSYLQFKTSWQGLSFSLAAMDREALQPGANNLRTKDEQSYALELAHLWEGLPNKGHVRVWANHADNEFNDGSTRFFEGGRSELGAEAGQSWGRHRLLGAVTLGERDTGGLVLPPPMLGPPGMGPPGMGPPGMGPPPPQPISLDLGTQSTSSLLLQDEIDLTPVALTLGLRYDRLEDFDSRISPRAAAVWRISERHTLKTQYAEGFRAATGLQEVEARSNGLDLDFETIDVAELQYVYRTPRVRFKLAAYDGEVQDLIRPQGMGAGFANEGEIDISGVEAEWSWQVSPTWKLLSNVSLTDADAIEQGNQVVGGANFAQPDYLANLASTWKPAEQWTLGAHLTLVGDREVQPGEVEDGYTLLNLAATWRPPAVEGLGIRLSVWNALDDDVTYLAFRPPSSVRRLNYDEPRVQLEATWNW